jgi:predicted MFS family arabinose efflux permease
VTGILVSRTISGLVAGVAGWRALFVFAAVLDVILAVILFRNLPRLEPKTSVKYSKLIASVGQVVVRERVVRWTLALGALSMCMFTMLWTSLTFFLSAPPFNYSVSIIGLFGLAGIAGAIAVQRLSKFHDRGWNLRLTGIATVLDIISFLISFFIGHSVIGIIVVLVLFDIATQTLNIMNQARVFSISHSARSRLNTAYVTSNFIGGAIGSFLAGILWSADDWKAISIGGIVLALSACTIWMLGHRGGGLHIQVKA